MKHTIRNRYSVIFKDEFWNYRTGALLSPVETQSYTIIQVADSYFVGPFTVAEHVQHCDLEITFSLSNGLCTSTNGSAHMRNRYDIDLSYKDETHALQSKKGGRYQTIAINFKHDSHPLLLAIKQKYAQQRNANLPEIAPSFSALISEFVTEKRPFTEAYIDSLITMILVSILRTEEQVELEKSLAIAENLTAILNHIDAHFLEIRSLEETIRQFGYDQGYICKIFKKQFAVTPGQYLLAKKMEHAKKLLKNGKSVKFISEQLGYSSPFNFSRAFKSHFGVSPTNYEEAPSD